MKSMHLAAAALIGVVAVPAVAADITGAGATFPAPVYLKWGEAFKAASGIGLNYQAIGSGAGQTQITNRTVDFGASDAPMAAERRTAANLLQFPTVIGAVVLTANLPNVDETKMRLTGPIIADMYLGKITSWADPRIKALNPSINLPNIPVVPVRRADSSGTTFVFTSYMSLQSADWKANVGAANSVEWKAGVGAKGNDGVAGAIKNTVGSIGYVEFVYAASNKLGPIMLANHDGKWVAPSEAGFAAAASRADWASAADLAPTMLNMPGPTAWPIVSATYILLPKNPKNADAAANVMKFVDFGYSAAGDAIASQLHYITLPADVKDRVRKAWAANIKAGNGQPLYRASR
jgi:phosphate transport system substrate-binding protein